MAVSTWVPKTPAQIAAAFATAFNSQPGVIPINMDAAATGGALSDAISMALAFIQNELAYTNSILRLATIPGNPDGSVSPDAASFAQPWAIVPLGGAPAIGAVEFTTPSPVSEEVIVPVGAIVATESGAQFVVTADSTNSAYTPNLAGYPIDVGDSTVTATVQCLTPGIIGNVVANTITQPISGVPPAVNQITNPSAFTNGAAGESNQAFKSRFTVAVSTGSVATSNAEIAAARGVQTGVIYSYGDRVNPDGSDHDAFFTLVVNVANSGTSAPSGLISAVQAAVNAVRAGGISFQVIGPTIVPVNSVATLTRLPSYTSAEVLTAAQAQYAAFGNAIGLNDDTTPTVLSLAKCYAALLQTQINGVYVVTDVQGLLLNGSAADVTAPFASQLVAGSASFTVP